MQPLVLLQILIITIVLVLAVYLIAQRILTRKQKAETRRTKFLKASPQKADQPVPAVGTLVVDRSEMYPPNPETLKGSSITLPKQAEEVLEKYQTRSP